MQFKRINKILMGCVSAVFVFAVIYVVVLTVRYSQREVGALTDQIKPRPALNLPELDGSSKAYDASVIARRNIFKPYDGRNGMNLRSADNIANEFQRNIKILGISFDEDFEVILENQVTRETYFVRKGDKILGAEIIGIQDNYVVFNLNDNEIVVYHEK